MDIDLLAPHIKRLDLSAKPAISDREKDFFRYYGIDFEDKINGVEHYFGHFPSGRFEIVAHYFLHPNAVETCFIFHGYFDHSGLYNHVIEYYLQRNFSVVIFDLPGHGLSTGDRATISHFSEYQSVLNDVLSFFSRQVPRPWYAIAQSTGSAILTEFMLRGGHEIFYKTVLLAPLVYPHQWRTGKWAYQFVKLFCNSIPRAFAENSNDKIFVEFLEHKDPLQHRRLPIQWVGALKQWINDFEASSSCDKSILIIQGLKDTTVEWQENIPMLQSKFSDVKTFYLQHGKHHLANEAEEYRQKMFSAMDIYFDVYFS